MTLPTAETGLTVDDLREAVTITREDSRRWPSLASILENLPEILDPKLNNSLPLSLSIDFAAGDLVLFRRSTRAEKLAFLADAQAAFNLRAETINQQYVDGEITLSQWESEAIRIVKTINVQSFAKGVSGDWESITFQMWGKLGAHIKVQRARLRDFVNTLQGGTKSIEYLNNRLKMYGSAARAAMLQADAWERGVPVLVVPAWPGDGTTNCRSRCRCRWAFQKRGKNTWFATWHLGIADHCRTCVARANRQTGWYRLKIVNGVIEPYTPIFADR